MEFKSKLKTLYKIIAIGILVSNIYFLYATIGIIRTSGGPMGWGLLALPFTIPANLLIIPAVLSLRKRHEDNNFLIAINTVGLLSIILIVCFVWFSF